MKLPRILFVDVTQDDIDKGKPAQPDSCPVALALRRAVEASDDIPVRVAGYNARVGHAGHGIEEWVKYTLSRPAIKFIQEFDLDAKVEPARFKLTRYAGTIGL